MTGRKTGLWEAIAGVSFSGTSLITIRPSSFQTARMRLLGFEDWGESIPRELLVLSESYHATDMVASLIK